MPDAIVLLKLEHQNILKLLDLVQQQLTNMTRRQPVNYRLLTSAFDHLAGYPNQCHHPKEELVYRKLARRHPEVAQSLQLLIDEHEKLAQLTSSLRRAVSESERDPAAANEGLTEQLQGYLDFYRRHIEMEERHVFPAATAKLSINDWGEIDFALFDQPDPLFSQKLEEEFAKCPEEITRLGVGEATSVADRDDATWLASLRDIAAFNEAMLRFGDPVQLTRSAAGGYELVCKDVALAQIPECSEARAAWCAWFFWKGHEQGLATCAAQATTIRSPDASEWKP